MWHDSDCHFTIITDGMVRMPNGDDPLQYALALSQFQAPGFAPAAAASKDAPLVLEPVTIVSVNAVGVVPRSYAPPGYADTSTGDYMTTMGYLENGNQRYVRALDMM